MRLCNLVFQINLMDGPSSRRTGGLWYNETNNSMHLLKLKGRVPRMSLGLNFWRDLLYTAAKVPKKAWGVCLHRFLYQRGCLINDMDNTHTTLWTFIVMHFTSPCSKVSMEAQAEIASWRKQMAVRCQGWKP